MRKGKASGLLDEEHSPETSNSVYIVSGGEMTCIFVCLRNCWFKSPALKL